MSYAYTANSHTTSHTVGAPGLPPEEVRAGQTAPFTLAKIDVIPCPIAQKTLEIAHCVC